MIVVKVGLVAQGFDDETHWVWDEACEAMGDA